MDIVGVTRTKDGKEVEEFVIGHSEHSYWYKGKPPLTHGCRECWTAYFVAQFAQSNGEADVDQLEAGIRHAAELAEKGQFDFKPDYSVKIEHED
jgi:hypothetical protein